MTYPPNTTQAVASTEAWTQQQKETIENTRPVWVPEAELWLHPGLAAAQSSANTNEANEAHAHAKSYAQNA